MVHVGEPNILTLIGDAAKNPAAEIAASGSFSPFFHASFNSISVSVVSSSNPNTYQPG